MKTQQATTPIGMSAGSILLVAGLLMGSFLPRTAGIDPSVPAPATDMAEASPQKAGVPAQPKRRPAHAALSMPYFSFAQLLRTGS